MTMLDPHFAFPEKLHVQWGSSFEQCLEALAVPVSSTDEQRGIECTLAVGEQDYAALLEFWPPTSRWPSRPSAENGLRLIRVVLYEAAEFSPFDLLDEGQETLPSDDRDGFWTEANEEYAGELQEAREHYDRVRSFYLEVLGHTPLSEEGPYASQHDGRTKAIIGWRHPAGNVALSLETDDGGDWPLDIVRLTITPPGEHFWFDNRTSGSPFAIPVLLPRQGDGA